MQSILLFFRPLLLVLSDPFSCFLAFMLLFLCWIICNTKWKRSVVFTLWVLVLPVWVQIQPGSAARFLLSLWNQPVPVKAGVYGTLVILFLFAVYVKKSGWGPVFRLLGLEEEEEYYEEEPEEYEYIPIELEVENPEVIWM